MPYKNPEDQKAYYLAHKEEIDAYRKAYRQEHKARLSKRSLERYHANPEPARRNHKKYYDNNKEKALESRRRYKHENRVKDRLYKNKRRQLLSSVEFPTEQWKTRLEKFNGFCPYCENTVEKLTVDHVIPISKGGTNDIWNLVPCCLICNSSKQSKLLWEWKPDFNFLHLMEYF